MTLAGRVALVTGGSRGIGQAVAVELARSGAKVAFCDIREPDPAVQSGRYFRADVGDRAGVEQLFGDVLREFGRLDILVNNAATNIRKPLVDLDVADVEKVWAVALWGVFHCSQLAARQMVKQGGGGKIVNISSVHEDIPFPQYAAYGAAKGGVRMLARDLALELAPYKINVNNIAPGAIATPINQAVLDNPQAKKDAITEIPWGRFGRPEEVAAVALFLASDDSDYVTGSTYYVDGGLTQQVTLY